MRYKTFFALLVCFTGYCCGQARLDSGTAAAQASAPRAVSMSSDRVLSGMPPSEVVIDPIQCNADGTIYLEGFDLTRGHLRTLYSVSSDGSVKMLNRNPVELEDLQLLAFYPGDDELVTLLEAKKRDASSGPQRLKYYLYITKLDGASGKTALLDLGVEPVNVAVLRSGKILLLGLDKEQQRPVLFMLDSDGSLLRRLDMQGDQYGSSKDLLNVYGEKRSDLHLILSSAKFVPFRDKVLFMQPASNLPILEIADGGIVASVTLHLPNNYLPDSLITSDYNWIVRARTIGASKKLVGSGVLMGEDRAVFEVNSEDGSVQRQLTFQGLLTSELACATGGEYTALHVDSGDSGAPASERWTIWSGKK